MAKCSSCGAEIIWVKVRPKLRPMPLNAKPEKRVVILGTTSLHTSDSLAQIMDTYVSHFATCPNAEQHRKQP